MLFLYQFGVFLASLAVVSTSPYQRPKYKKNFTVHESIRKQYIKSGPAAVLSTYNKYNKKPPADVVEAAAANDGRVAANPIAFDTRYLSLVTIGGQDLYLDFDSGSADL